MKKLLVIGVISLVLFALSATVSFFLQKSKTSQEPTGEEPGMVAKEGGDGKEAPSGKDSAPRSTEPRVAVRPPFNPATADAAQLASELRGRLNKVLEREKQLEDRKRDLRFIVEDIRTTKSEIDNLRKLLSNESKALEESMAGLDRQKSQLSQEQARTNASLQEMEGKRLKLLGEEENNIKKMAAMYNTMEPERAASLVQSLSDKGQMETAAKILALMQERRAASVLAELAGTKPGQDLATQLTDRIKSLRKPGAAPSTSASPEAAASGIRPAIP
jgi:flagellar motility protein MotE (MotC chaperone)